MQKTMLVTRKGEIFHKWSRVSVTLMARDWKGMGNYPFNAVLVKKDRNSTEKPNERT